MRNLLCVLVVCLLLLGVAAAQEPANPLFEQLISKGLPVPGGPPVVLPRPLCPPGQVQSDPAKVEAILEEAAGNLPTNLFLKRSQTAPFNLKVDSVEAKDGERRAQEIKLKFVAYGDLKEVADSDFLKQLFAGKQKKGGGNATVVLGPQVLSERGIKPTHGPGEKETYETMALTLLEKVEVVGVTRTVRTVTPASVLYVTVLDERFKDDKENPNRWRSIVRNADGVSLGPPAVYQGLGGYVLATALPEPKGALLIEMHFVLHEPADWFGGKNLLRAKLPVVIQEDVRSFRQKLK